MVMEDELLSYDRLAVSNRGQQSDLIRKYCDGIEHKIQNALTRADAARLMDEACRDFQNECPSSVLRRELRLRVQEIVDRHWSKST